MYSEKQLEQMVKERASNIVSGSHKDLFDHLCNNLSITQEEILDAIVAYDVHADEVGNEVYKDQAMRAAMHTLYLADGSYHKEREQAVIDYLNEIKPSSVCEIGYGTPTRWVTELALEGKYEKVTLIDMDESAQAFSEALLDFFDPKKGRNEHLSYLLQDMDTLAYPGDHDVYILMDAIEHTKDPTAYLQELTRNSPAQSNFIFSLPIGKISDFNSHFHYIEWVENKDAIKWLEENNLKVLKQKTATPNPEVDYFVHSLTEDFHNLLVLCQKQ